MNASSKNSSAADNQQETTTVTQYSLELKDPLQEKKRELDARAHANFDPNKVTTPYLVNAARDSYMSAMHCSAPIELLDEDRVPDEEEEPMVEDLSHLENDPKLRKFLV